MTDPNEQSGKQVAEAIAMEASRLQRLALKHEQHFLAYLLEMVLLEAWREASGEPPADDALGSAAELRGLGLES